MAVVFAAVTFGIWPAVFASVLSFLAYNLFFIEPLYTFTVAKPHELLALVVFLADRRGHLDAGRTRARAGADGGGAHAGDAAALRVHAPALRASPARRHP